MMKSPVPLDDEATDTNETIRFCASSAAACGHRDAPLLLLGLGLALAHALTHQADLDLQAGAQEHVDPDLAEERHRQLCVAQRE